MVDELNTPDTPQAPEAATVAPVEAPPKQGFFATSKGRLVVIVGALAALAVIAGVAVALVFFVFGDSEPEVEVRVTGSTESTATTGGEPTAEAAATPAPEVPNSEVFTFRDIFEPLLKPIPEASGDSTVTPGTSVPTTDTANTYTPGTLFLQNIVSENGELLAVLIYDGTTYTLGEGERVGDSPWQVLEVRADSVVMLYGDTQVVLTVGQGVTK